MARYFNGSSNKIEIADAAALSLIPPFTLVAWIRIDDNTDYRHLFNWNDPVTDDWVIVYVRKEGATDENDIAFLFRDSAGDYVGTLAGYAVGSNRDWQHYAITCSSGGEAKHWCDGVGKGGMTNAAFGGVNAATDFIIGNNGSAWWNGGVAEVAKYDIELDATQIGLLAAGIRPVDVGVQPAWYLPMIGDLGEQINDLSVTNTGTTPLEHPPKVIMQGGLL